MITISDAFKVKSSENGLLKISKSKIPPICFIQFLHCSNKLEDSKFYD